MTTDERVQALADYGFTERQARFLVLVMRHAGPVRQTPVCRLRRHRQRRREMQRVFREARQTWACRRRGLHPQPRAALPRPSPAAVPRHRAVRQPLPTDGTRAVGRRAADATRCGADEPESRLAHHTIREGRLPTGEDRARVIRACRQRDDCKLRRTSPNSFLGPSRSGSMRAGTSCSCTSRRCLGPMTSGRSSWGTRRCSGDARVDPATRVSPTAPACLRRLSDSGPRGAGESASRGHDL